MAKIQIIRNATLKITYNGTSFLVDPMLGNQGAFESYGNIAKNPIVDLPFSKDEILDGVQAVLISHLHEDHFDATAKQILDKSLPIYCHPSHQKKIANQGFINTTAIYTAETHQQTKIHRTLGKHGSGKIAEMMGEVSGFVLQAKNEPTIYIVGDSIFNDDVKKAIDTFQPDVIFTNSGGAFIPGYESDLILMDAHETIALANYAFHSKIVAIHLEALDHCTVNRAALQRALLASSIHKNRFFIPVDGTTLTFTT